jgi:protein-tyrosine-phosphatase
MVKMKKINILFVCRYNRFRSRVAESCFNKLNKNKNIKAKSAGLIKGMPLNPKTVSIAKKFGFDISGKPKGLSSKLLAWQNLTVIVADDVPEQVFDRNKKYGKRVINWKIKDAKEYNLKEIERLVKEIVEKVCELNKELAEK